MSLSRSSAFTGTEGPKADHQQQVNRLYLMVLVE